MAQTHIPPRSGGPRAPFGGDRPTHAPANSFSEVVFVPAARLREGQKIEATLYSDTAETAARIVAGGNPRNKPSQLRRFYDELVALADKVGSDPRKFEEQRPFIQMLKAKVAYAKGRDKVDDNFRSLLSRVVDQAVDADTLRQARLFMEAFMGFYKVYRPSEA